MGGGAGGLRLSEVLADAVEPGIDGAYEWVELVNVSDTVVSTAGWAIGDAGAVDALPAVEVPPGGYVVVAAEAAVLPVNVLVARTPDGTIGNGLNNAGDAVRLVSPAGVVVDALSFGENRDVFDSPPPAAGAGATLGARSPDSGGAGGPARWAVTLRPSPGAPNAFPPPTATATATPAESVALGASGAPPATAPSQPSADGIAGADAPGETAGGAGARFEQTPREFTSWLVLGAVAGLSGTVSAVALGGAWRASGGRRRRGG